MTDEQPKTMQAGDNPDDFTVDQVNAYLADADTAELARVQQAEGDGQGRKGILLGPAFNGEGPSEPEDEPADPSYSDMVERADTTDAFIIPSHNTVPQDVQDQDAAARNQELEDAGVNQAQGFIGSDGSANLLS